MPGPIFCPSPALAEMTNTEAEAHLKKGLDPPLCFSYFIYPIHLQRLVSNVCKLAHFNSLTPDLHINVAILMTFLILLYSPVISPLS